MGTLTARFEHEGQTLWGTVQGRRVIPVGEYASTRDFLERGREAARQASGLGLPLTEVRLLSPVTRPARVIAQGVNYAAHRQEGGYGAAKPPFNMIFTKADSSICGPTDAVVCPPHVKLLDYEIELGLVIGKTISGPAEVTPENLHEYVAGLTVTNDVSARDIQIPQEQWDKGKSYRTFCPTGPYLYLLDAGETGLLGELELRLWVNGELRQSASTAEMLYKPAETLRELSALMDFSPGDLILTGTPSGVAITPPPKLVQRVASLLPAERRSALFVKGQLRNPRYLKAGDLIRAQIYSRDGQVDLGTQLNTVQAGRG